MLMMDDGRRILSTASFTSTGFKYEMYNTGELLMDSLALYSEVGSELGYL